MRSASSVLALAGALMVVTVGGCSADARPGAAAVVNGTVYSQAEVDDIATELTPVANSAQGAATATVQFLVIGDGVRELAAESGAVVSAEDARTQFADAFEQAGVSADALSDGALGVLATSLMTGLLAQTPEGDQALTELLAGLDVELNPRYGEVQVDEVGRFSIQPAQYPWLVGDPAADASVAP